MRNLFGFLFLKPFYCLIAIAIQGVAIVLLCLYLPATLPFALGVAVALALQLAVVFSLSASPLAPEQKCGTLFLCLALPVVGAVIYFLSCPHRHDTQSGTLLATSIRQATYFADGNQYFTALFDAMRNARYSIYLEYYIIGTGTIFLQLCEILQQATKRGVEVKVIADSVGSAFRLPPRAVKQLKRTGAQIKLYRRAFPLLSLRLNSRNHSKLALIDGTLAFTGGVNLADEYANLTSPHGYWKDTGVAVWGNFADALQQQFLQAWYGKHGGHNRGDFNKGVHLDYGVPHDGNAQSDLKPQHINKLSPTPYCGFNGFYGATISAPSPYISVSHACLFFCDTPPHNVGMGENVLVNAIERATNRICIFTPYFCPTERCKRALAFASIRGVPVTILLPHVPDKKMIYWLSLAYAEELLAYGVRFYTYTPGFLHAKNILIDDMLFMGSYNLDCRSFLSNSECGFLLSAPQVVEQAVDDFNQALSLSLPLVPRTDFGFRLCTALLRPFSLLV
jgi:cardiolipin synthase